MADALPTKTFQIDNDTYETDMMPATEGRALVLVLVKAIAPAFEKLTFDAKDPAKQEAEFLAAAVNVISQLDNNVLDQLCNAFGSRTRHVVGPTQKPQLTAGYFGLHFAGRYVAMFRWVFECCQANGFLSFLPGK